MLQLQRIKQNPILKPTKLPWENVSVFNPGAIILNKQVCLLYRALGTIDRVSRLGIAESDDGIRFIRHTEPIYSAYNHKFETLGIEDVRVVTIDNVYYLVYTAVSTVHDKYTNPVWEQEGGHKIPRVALSTTKDFINFTDHDVILPHITGKDASLFPKKVNGKYWLLYRVDLETTYFSSSSRLDVWDKSYPVFGKGSNYWDAKRTGIGNPPIETEKGWLIFYHGIDEKNIYRLGIMFLDLQNPTKVIYRSPYPVFEPLEDYEKHGDVPNVVFTCGVIEKNNSYYVYYGAADRVIGLATVKKKDVLNLF